MTGMEQETVTAEPAGSLGKEPLKGRKRKRTPEELRQHHLDGLKGIANDQARRAKRAVQTAQVELGKAMVHSAEQPYLKDIELALKGLAAIEAKIIVLPLVQ